MNRGVEGHSSWKEQHIYKHLYRGKPKRDRHSQLLSSAVNVHRCNTARNGTWLLGNEHGRCALQVRDDVRKKVQKV